MAYRTCSESDESLDSDLEEWKEDYKPSNNPNWKEELGDSLIKNYINIIDDAEYYFQFKCVLYYIKLINKELAINPNSVSKNLRKKFAKKTKYVKFKINEQDSLIRFSLIHDNIKLMLKNINVLRIRLKDTDRSEDDLKIVLTHIEDAEKFLNDKTSDDATKAKDMLKAVKERCISVLDGTGEWMPYSPYLSDSTSDED